MNWLFQSELGETYDQDFEMFEQELLESVPLGVRKLLNAHFRTGNLSGVTSFLRRTVEDMKKLDADELLDLQENFSSADFLSEVNKRLSRYSRLQSLFDEWVQFLDKNGGVKRLSSYAQFRIRQAKVAS